MQPNKSASCAHWSGMCQVLLLYVGGRRCRPYCCYTQSGHRQLVAQIVRSSRCTVVVRVSQRQPHQQHRPSIALHCSNSSHYRSVCRSVSLSMHTTAAKQWALRLFDDFAQTAWNRTTQVYIFIHRFNLLLQAEQNLIDFNNKLNIAKLKNFLA